jgi:hypothetical protein
MSSWRITNWAVNPVPLAMLPVEESETYLVVPVDDFRQRM